MINTPQTLGQLPYSANSQPLRRPGWGLIQDVRPHQTRHRPAAIQSESRHQPPTPAVSTRPTPRKSQSILQKQRLAQWLQKHVLILTAPLIIIASIRLSGLPIIAQSLIVAYGLVAIVWKIPSQISFWLATMVLAGIGVQFLLLPGTERVNNSALFVFLLLCIGLVTSILETRRMVMRDMALRRT